MKASSHLYRINLTLIIFIMDSLAQDAERLLREAYNNMHLPPGAYNRLSRNEFKTLALRRLAAILPNLALPCTDYDELPRAMDIAASSFLVRYEHDLWPGQNTPARSNIRQAVRDCFYSLLRLRAEVPANPELATFLAHSLPLEVRRWPTQLETSGAQLEQDKLLLNQKATLVPRRSSSRSTSAPTLPKPEWPLEKDVVETEDLTNDFEALDLGFTEMEEAAKQEEEEENPAFLHCKAIVEDPDVECGTSLESEGELLQHYKDEHYLDDDYAREKLAEVVHMRSKKQA